MAQSKPILYSYFRSSCSWRVRIALAFKGIDYEYKAVNLLKGEHLSEDYKKLNPSAEVPAFVDKGKVLTHSFAILEYLEDTVPESPLLPKDAFARAHVRALVDAIVAGIQPLQNMKVLKYVGDPSKLWAKYWIESGFKSVETMLRDTHGKYCVGDDVTLADVCLVPQLYNANRFNVDMSPFPLITEITSRLNDLEPFKVSRPEKQPDCPSDLKYTLL